ncbi:MAG: hypothetical protein ACM3ZF_05160 [Mycobacterium leprae]
MAAELTVNTIKGPMSCTAFAVGFRMEDSEDAVITFAVFTGVDDETIADTLRNRVRDVEWGWVPWSTFTEHGTTAEDILAEPLAAAVDAGFDGVACLLFPMDSPPTVLAMNVQTMDEFPDMVHRFRETVFAQLRGDLYGELVTIPSAPPTTGDRYEFMELAHRHLEEHPEDVPDLLAWTAWRALKLMLRHWDAVVAAAQNDPTIDQLYALVAPRIREQVAEKPLPERCRHPGMLLMTVAICGASHLQQQGQYAPGIGINPERERMVYDPDSSFDTVNRAWAVGYGWRFSTEFAVAWRLAHEGLVGDEWARSA